MILHAFTQGMAIVARPGVRRSSLAAIVLLAAALLPAQTPAGAGRAEGALGPAASPVAAPAATPAPAAASANASAEAATLELLRGLVDGGVPGIGVAVGVGGELAFAGGAGFADLEHRVPVGPATRFRIASVSKPVTAALVAVLVREGRLDIDAPVRRYVPSFPDKGDGVTLRRLGGHLGGIRHYRGDEMLSTRHYDSVVESLAMFADDPLAHPPGSKYLYSSYGFNLLSAAAEAAAGKPFLAALDEKVLKPIGMAETGPDRSDALVPNRARPYRRNPDNSPKPAPYVDNSCKWAGGGLLASMRDLVRFGNAHLAPGFHDQASLDLLFTPQATLDGHSTAYGIGWGVGSGNDGGHTVTHSGGAVGGTSFLLVLRDARIVVALAANLERAPVDGKLARRIATLWKKG